MIKLGLRRDATDGFNAQLYGTNVHEDVRRFIQNQRPLAASENSLGASLAAAASKAASEFMNNKHIEFVRKVTNELSVSENKGERVITALMTGYEMQMAGETMTKYVMALPAARHAFIRGDISGYDGMYFDAQPGVVGFGHKPFMRATNEVIGGDGVVMTYVFNDNERALTLGEQADIKATWRVLTALLEDGEIDPTSPYRD